jgi:hypothetical protein
MNKSTFIQTGGYPLKAERLQELQTAYSIFNALGALAGDLTIILGCEVLGTNVGDGYVYIEGELYHFKGGAFNENSTVIIIEEPVNRGFKNGVVKQVYAIRYATFGTNPEASWPWASFKAVDAMSVMMARLDTMEKKTAVFQAGGGMVLWNKAAADIPNGWQEVVDWRGRMPVGFDENQTEFNAVGKPGGAKNKTLSVNELPKHNFYTFSPSNTAISNNTVDGNTFPVADADGTGWGNETYRIRRSATKPTLGKSSEIGGDQQFSLLNPYRVVLFIEYIG